MSDVTLIKGDATERWQRGDNSLDSIVCDPPYNLEFMGRNFDTFTNYAPKTDKAKEVLSAFAVFGLDRGDAGYVAFTVDWATEALRCLKPGAFILAFGGTRTADLMSMGFRIAGLEKLDEIESISWVYLSGMPKAQDIGKMFDKAFPCPTCDGKGFVWQHTDGHIESYGAGTTDLPEAWEPWSKIDCPACKGKGKGAEREVVEDGTRSAVRPHVPDQSGGKAYRFSNDASITAPATDLAKKWDGWKTPSLKPSHEPVLCFRKPLIGTYIQNIEEWGVGGINVDACRIGTSTELHGSKPRAERNGFVKGFVAGTETQSLNHGRFPANTIISHTPLCTEEACVEGCPVKVLDEQSGIKVSKRSMRGDWNSAVYGADRPHYDTERGHDDVGGASKIFAKFFYEGEDFAPFRYQAKASRKERDEGCDNLPMMKTGGNQASFDGGKLLTGSGNERSNYAKNGHPTVKPKELIKYLMRLTTPQGGITASPFLGSGTDAVAAIEEGFHFWGMNLPDREGEEYWPIIEARVAHALKSKDAPKPAPKRTPKPIPTPKEEPVEGQMRLF